jgi:hypothetical protein
MAADRKKLNMQLGTVGRLLTSHTALALCYGVFLFLYELPILRVLLEPVHPVLIAWAGALALYDVAVRKLWKQLPMWQWLVGFAVLAGVSAVVNHEAGLVDNVKTWILTCLPLVAFLPLCLLTDKREKALLTAFSGGAVVACIASGIAIVLYLLRISTHVEFMGVTKFVGYCYYVPNDPNSGILLYGLYADTNQASTYAIVFAAYGLWLLDACRRGIFGKWKGAVKTFAIVSLAVQLCYFPLANSRGGWLCLAVAGVLCVFLYGFCTRLKTDKKAKRALLALVIAVLSVAVLCGGLLVARSGLSLASKAILYQPAFLPDSGETGGSPVRPDVQPIDPGIPEADVFQKADMLLGAGRVAIWKEALQLFAKFPILGVGPNNATYYAKQLAFGEKLRSGFSLHNSFLEVLVGFGALGFAALMVFFVSCAWMILRKLFCNGRQLGARDHLCVFAVVFLAGASLLLNGLFINTTAMYFLFLCGLSYALSRCRAKEVNG